MISRNAAVCSSCGAGFQASGQASEGLFLRTLNAGCLLILVGVGTVEAVILGVFIWNTILWATR